MYIYLGGPKPKNNEELMDRARLIDGLHEIGFSVFDPWGAWAGGARPGHAVAVINLTAAINCDALVAHCPSDATGTAIEIGYVLAGGKPVITWGDTDGAMFCHFGIVRVKNEAEALTALGSVLAGPGEHSEYGSAKGCDSA